MRNTDCIYYVGIDEDTGMHVCKYSHSLYKDEEDMCKNCKLWDAYIPATSNKAQIERAKYWQSLIGDEQPNYDEFFKIKE